MNTSWQESTYDNHKNWHQFFFLYNAMKQSHVSISFSVGESTQHKHQLMFTCEWSWVSASFPKANRFLADLVILHRLGTRFINKNRSEKQRRTRGLSNKRTFRIIAFDLKPTTQITVVVSYWKAVTSNHKATIFQMNHLDSEQNYTQCDQNTHSTRNTCRRRM